VLKMDLSGRYMRAKFNELIETRAKIVTIPVVLFFAYICWDVVSLLMSDPNISYMMLVDTILVKIICIIALVFFLYLALGTYVVIKFSKNPESAFCVFGREKTIHTIIGLLPFVFILVFIFLLASIAPNHLHIKDDHSISVLRNEIHESAGYIQLQKNKSGNAIDEKVLKGINTIENWFQDDYPGLTTAFIKIRNTVFKALFLIYPFVLLLEFLLAYILHMYLKRKLAT